MKRFYYCLLFGLSLVSCNDSESPTGKYTSGIFVVNEGNFTEADGSIDFFTPGNSTVVHDVFKVENGIERGGVIQSIFFDNNRIFIMDQKGNKIDVVKADDFTLIATIDNGLSSPRYMTMINGEAYVSNWGPFDANFQLQESFIAVVNLDSYQVEKSIPTPAGPEALVSFGDQLYVPNSFSNTISVISSSTKTITSQFTVPDGPLQLVEDKNGKWWLLSNSFITGSMLSRLNLNNEEVELSFPIGSSAKSLVFNGSADQLFILTTPFQSEASVLAISIEATEAPVAPIITGPNLYGIGIDPVANIIYLGNSNAFQGNGTVIRYSTDGQMIDSFSVGRGPNSFLFR